MLIQVYAFTRVHDALQAANIGVNHIGFVAGDYGLVHGELTFEKGRQLVASMPPRVTAVALTMATAVDEIMRMAEVVRPHIVHISTDPEQVGLQAMQALHQEMLPGIKLMKAIPVVDLHSIDQARAFAEACDFLLLDTKIHGLPGVGATGRIHDWTLSRQIVAAVRIPVILAGGLTPENVGEAIKAVQPAGVDSNTSTNVPGNPVQKDMQRIRRFVEAVHHYCPERENR